MQQQESKEVVATPEPTPWEAPDFVKIDVSNGTLSNIASGGDGLLLS